MGFHRLAVPAYFGGLPGGYDYLNNAIAGTPAPANGVKVGGPNTGTYFIAYSEDATAADVNRPAKALGENTDYLDDLLRRPIATWLVTNDVTAGSPVSSIILTGPGIFIGESGTPNTGAGIRTFVQVTDENDNEIFDGSGLECRVTAISPDTPGADFSTGSVTLTISPAIPVGKTYRAYYGVRSNLATFSTGFTRRAVRRWNVAPAVAGSPYALLAGVSSQQLAGLLGFINTLAPIVTQLAPVLSLRTVTGAATINTPDIDGTIILNPAASASLQLPNPTTCTGRRFFLLNGTGTMSLTNKYTLVRFGSELINGLAASYDLSVPFGGWTLVSDGTNWHIRFMPA